MPDGSLEVIKKDYSKEVKEAITESNAIVSSGKSLEDAIQLLLSFEKQCRVSNDTISLSNICVHIIRLCYQSNDWPRLISSLVLLNKRRTQSKYAIIAFVTEALSYLSIAINPKVVTHQLDSEIIASDSDMQIDKQISPTIHPITNLPKAPLTDGQERELLQTLMSICDGKMYLEAESARIHMSLAHIYEKEGDLIKACEYIQDVHVETYGSLSKLEKAEYILEQIRLNLLNKDYIRALLQSRKMNRKTIEEEGFLDVKIRFYTMQIEYHLFSKETWDISQSYYKLFEAYSTKSDSDKSLHCLESTVIFLVLSPYDSNQQDMLHRLKGLKETRVEQSLLSYSLLSLFSTNEIIPMSFAVRESLEVHSSLRSFNDETTNYYLPGQLNSRVIEHNIRVIAKAYSRINLSRLATILNLSVETIEESLSEISQSGFVSIKINRSQGIVSFESIRSNEEILSDYGSDVAKLLHLMESTCHLIRRENMVHKI